MVPTFCIFYFCISRKNDIKIASLDNFERKKNKNPVFFLRRTENPWAWRTWTRQVSCPFRPISHQPTLPPVHHLFWCPITIGVRRRSVYTQARFTIFPSRPKLKTRKRTFSPDFSTAKIERNYREYFSAKKGRGFFRRGKKKAAKSVDGLSAANFDLESEMGRKSRHSRRGEDEELNTKFEEERNVRQISLFFSPHLHSFLITTFTHVDNLNDPLNFKDW